MLYDAHTHLNGEELYPRRQECLLSFVEAGGAGLINAGASDAYNHRGIEIAREAKSLVPNCSVKATIGYHPDCCSQGEITQENIQQKIAELQMLYEQNNDVVVSIGECGIDTYYPGTEKTLALQKKLFTLQCDLAKKLHLPLMVHIRKDFATGLEILKNYRDMTIHFHCRSFGPEEVEILQQVSRERDWNLFIGFCGNISYKNAQNLRDSLARVPIDQLLLETDAPRLSPQVVRGTTNHPANVKYIYDYVAQHTSPSLAEISAHIEKNYHSAYNI